MLRFAFKPRHPITQVAFTADSREIVTAQPFTSVAVRDRLTGEAHLTFELSRVPSINSIAVHVTEGWIGVRTNSGNFLVGPQWDKGWCTVTTGNTSFGTTAGSLPIVSWTNYTNPRFFSLSLPSPESNSGLFVTLPTTSIRTAGHMIATSPDAVFALCLRAQTRPILALITTGELIAELSAPIRLRHVTSGHVVAFSPDGSKLALCEGDTLSVFDLSSVPREVPEGSKRKIVHPLVTLERPDPTKHGTFADKQAEHWLPPVAFDHAGRTMFTLGLRNRVQRIDLATGGVMSEWGWRCEPIRSLAVAPDDLTAAAGCQRGELVLWDLE